MIVGMHTAAVKVGLLISSAAAVVACGSTSHRTTTPTTTPPAAAATTTPASTSSAPTSSPPTTAAAATGSFNSCSVVTQAEAASALGQSVDPGSLGNATVEGGKACVFYGPSAPSVHDDNVAEGDTVRVVVVEGSDALTWYNDYKSKVHSQPISGYGDQAYYDGYASLSVLKGGDVPPGRGRARNGPADPVRRGAACDGHLAQDLDELGSL